MSMDNEDIAIAINAERMGSMQAQHGDYEAAIRHRETSAAAWRRLGDTVQAEHADECVRALKARITDRAA